MIIWSSFGVFIVNSCPKKDEWWTSDQGHGPEKLTDARWDRRLARVIMSYCSSHCWKKCMLVQDVRMHSVSQFTVYSAALLQNNEFPSWLLYTPESTNNGRMNIRTWPWRNGRRQPGLINPILLYIMWIARCVWVVYQDALWEDGNPAERLRCFGQCSPGEPWVLPCMWVLLTCTNYLSIVWEHVHPLIEMVIPDGCGLF